MAVAEKKAADAKAKLAANANAKAQATKQSSLTAAESAEQKSAGREANKRRTPRLRCAASSKPCKARSIATSWRSRPPGGECPGPPRCHQ